MSRPCCPERPAGWRPRARRAGAALVWLLAGLAPQAPGWAQSDPSRGGLLYDTHCIACHRVQVHWRDQRLVTDWASLVEQVRHWQARALLEWSDADVLEVARYLNRAVYRLPTPGRQG